MTEELTFKKKLARWHVVKAEAAAAASEEVTLRKELFGEAFPNPIEGSKENKCELGDGYILQGDYKINRRVDESALPTVREKLSHDVFDKVIKFKASLNKAGFNSLTAEQKAIFADAVIETPGTPALEIKQPKRK